MEEGGRENRTELVDLCNNLSLLWNRNRKLSFLRRTNEASLRLSVSQQHLPGRRLRVRGLRSPAAQRRRRRQRRGLLGARQPFIRSLRNHHTQTQTHTHLHTHSHTSRYIPRWRGWMRACLDGGGVLPLLLQPFVTPPPPFFAAVFSICLLCFSFS